MVNHPFDLLSDILIRNWFPLHHAGVYETPMQELNNLAWPGMKADTACYCNTRHMPDCG